MKLQETKNLETVTFGAGCFWQVEEDFRVIKGVVSTEVGFMGGTVENPTYDDVSGEKTGHAESVQIKFDPSQVSYEELLKVFWENHNPTMLNRQGPDVGLQYRSVIFFHTPEQEKLAKKSKEELEKSEKYKEKIVTEIVPAATFYKADEEHQKYLMKKGLKTCHP